MKFFSFSLAFASLREIVGPPVPQRGYWTTTLPNCYWCRSFLAGDTTVALGRPSGCLTFRAASRVGLITALRLR